MATRLGITMEELLTGGSDKLSPRGFGFVTMGSSGEPAAEVRQQCHEHIDQVLDECAGDAHREIWTLVELQRHFPTHPLKATPNILPAKKASQALPSAASIQKPQHPKRVSKSDA